jgi:pimeloyl-ACP methyl ester carboxylesterase
MTLIHHVATGEGRPPIVFVHGFACGHTDWDAQVAHLSPRHRTVAVDLRGHGASPRGSAGLGPAELAADVLETVAARPDGGPAGAGLPGGRAGPGLPGGRAGPAVDLLVGHSLGALVALALLAGRPGLARRVVLEDPPGPAAVDWDELADGIESDVGRARREPEALRAELEAANPAWAPGEAARRVADCAACDVATVAPAARGGLPLDLARVAAAVDVPTLLLLAQEALGSTLVGPDRKALVDALPQVTVRELPTGHSVHRESLAGWLGALDEWLAGPAGGLPPPT